jgi:hypothetical protein
VFARRVPQSPAISGGETTWDRSSSAVGRTPTAAEAGAWAERDGRWRSRPKRQRRPLPRLHLVVLCGELQPPRGRSLLGRVRGGGHHAGGDQV